jgi:short-subunit dehydrogenase
VNVSSIFGMIAVPGNSAYHAAKFGIRGFTESLRAEMTADATNVKISCVHPGGIKTNVARNARLAQNEELLARKEEITQGFDDFARTTPEEAARVIFTGIEKDNPRILIGGDARFMDRIQRLMPVKYQNILGRLFRRNED